ncbi:MAG: maleylpyruvate isomerase family mycothiol-dependent enzyme [Actinomycetota bacterium]
MSFTLSDYVDAHRGLFAYYNDLAGRLSVDEMATQSLCPDWSVRAVITHALGVEVVLTGWAPSAEAPPPFEKMGAWEAEASGLSPADFASRVQEITADRLAHLESLDESALEAAAFTPTGLGTYEGFLQIRVFDLWIHARDIAIPLGEVLDDSGPAAEMTLNEVDGAVGYIVGKKIALPEGKSIVFSVRGGVERDISVVVDGRATRVDEVPSPDVTLRADVGTFVMLAAGRIEPQEQLDAGTISWAGDDEWGRTAALNLAYTR